MADFKYLVPRVGCLVLLFMILANSLIGVFTVQESKTPPEDPFLQAQAAFDRNDLDAALVLLSQATAANPRNVSAHILMGKCFTKGRRYPQAIQLFSALILHPEVRGNAELSVHDLDAPMVDALLGWALSIETNGFNPKDLKLFSRAVEFYAEHMRGRRTVEIIGLDEGLKRRQPVTQTFTDIIRAKDKS